MGYFMVGEFEKAVERQGEAHATMEKILGGEHLETAKHAANLGNTYLGIE